MQFTIRKHDLLLIAYLQKSMFLHRHARRKIVQLQHSIARRVYGFVGENRASDCTTKCTTCSQRILKKWAPLAEFVMYQISWVQTHRLLPIALSLLYDLWKNMYSVKSCKILSRSEQGFICGRRKFWPFQDKRILDPSTRVSL